MLLRNLKRAAEGTPSPHGPHKRAKTAKGSASQPILMDDSQPKLSIRTSPQGTKSTSNAINHLAQKLLGHGYDRKGKLDSITLPRGQTTLKIITEGGVDVP
ncbi:hypothetical protein Ptr902_13397 [Pyrenophora tritici-repentis]|nr:hypothetical protein Ptr902_13397 [Pyrenophora tritici-repentis]